MEVAPAEDAERIPSKNTTRYKKRLFKRQWEEMRKDENEPKEKKDKECGEKPERIKKKKVAMLLGYCGANYHGMQRNPGVRTIEEDLLTALRGAKYITKEDFENQQNAHFQRSSRTDKGVSAARQVVSLKMSLDYSIEELNSRLPECIRIFNIKRVTNKFNSKTKCDARTYSYTLPTYVFDSALVTNEDRRKYRITKEKLDEIDKVLSVYKGTKCYHNFTEKKYYNDPSANRYMMSFGVERIFVDSDMEFAVLCVKGQSFMIHQIRKMVGLTIALVRGHADHAILDKVFTKEKVMIPTAPGLGLMLNMVHYDGYDNKFKGTHGVLTWDSDTEAVNKFTRDYIYPSIVAGEVEEDNMGVWLEKITEHSYEPHDDDGEDKNDGENKNNGENNVDGENSENDDCANNSNKSVIDDEDRTKKV